MNLDMLNVNVTSPLFNFIVLTVVPSNLNVSGVAGEAGVIGAAGLACCAGALVTTAAGCGNT